MLVMLDTPMPLGMPVVDTLAMVPSLMLALLHMPIIHMLLSPLDPARVLTPSLKDLTQSPRDLSIELVHNMASVRLKLMPMLKLSAPTQLVMDMATLAFLTQLVMLVLDTLDFVPWARDLLMPMPMPK